MCYKSHRECVKLAFKAHNQSWKESKGRTKKKKGTSQEISFEFHKIGANTKTLENTTSLTEALHHKNKAETLAMTYFYKI